MRIKPKLHFSLNIPHSGSNLLNEKLRSNAQLCILTQPRISLPETLLHVEHGDVGHTGTQHSVMQALPFFFFHLESINQ